MAEMQAKLTLKNAEFNTGLQSAQEKLKSFNERLSDPVTSITSWARALPAIGGIIGLIQVGIGTVRAFGEGIENAFKSAMKRQELIADFQAFYGSVDASKAKIKEFSDYARHTSFSTDDVAEGALRLDVLTNGAMQGAEALHTIGDVATDTGKNFTEVSTAVGLLYSRIASGGAFERPLMALEKLGVITPVVSAKIRDMIDNGESTAATWKLVHAELDQFKGTTENVASTVDGSMDKIRKNTSAIFQALAMPVVDMATPWFKRVAEESDNTRTSLSSWKGVWDSLLRGFSLVTFAVITSIRAASGGLSILKDIFLMQVRIIARSGSELFLALADASIGKFSSASNHLKLAAQAAKDVTKAAGDSIAKTAKSQLEGMGKDYLAMRQSIMDIDNPAPAPDLKKQTQFDPEDGEDPAQGPSALDSKRRELADLEASAHEKTMTNLERINDLQKRRNDLLAQAAWWAEHTKGLDPKQDQGAIAKSEGHELAAKIEAAKLDEQIGQAQETREQKIAELKQRILERSEKLLEKNARIAALQDEKSKLDVNNPDEEISLTAKARAGAIDDEIKELNNVKSKPEMREAGQPYEIAGSGPGSGPKPSMFAPLPQLDKDGIYQGGGMFENRSGTHHTMGEIERSVGRGLPNFKSPGVKVAGVSIKVPDAAAKQISLQTEMVKSLHAIQKHIMKPASTGHAPPMARFGH